MLIDKLTKDKNCPETRAIVGNKIYIATQNSKRKAGLKHVESDTCKDHSDSGQCQ